MTDRELLEMAAKAAGIDVHPGTGWQADMLFLPVPDATGVVTGVAWNPLVDDAQALRLAVNLNLKTVFHPVLRQALVWRYLASGDEWTENAEDHDDPYAATRRAIVRAAAEIGSQMP